MHGFYRIAAASPRIRVGDPDFNAAEIIALHAEALRGGVSAVVFPELCVSGATCGDAFADAALAEASEAALGRIAAATAGSGALLIAGAPWRRGSRLFNTAAVISGGRMLGRAMMMRADRRGWFCPAEWAPHPHEDREQRRLGEYPHGAGIVFGGTGAPFSFGVEIGGDALALLPPSANMALDGAHAIFAPGAEPEAAGGADARRARIAEQSRRIAGLVAYAGAGAGESTADDVRSGHCIIAFNGEILAEGGRFGRGGSIIFADFKPAWCDALRMRRGGFGGAADHAPGRARCAAAAIPAPPEAPDFSRLALSPLPFAPEDPAALRERCRETARIQCAGLVKRMESAGARRLALGLSGGLDSALALMVCADACDALGLPRSAVLCVSMPCFGTSRRTKSNAARLAALMGAELRVIKIAPAVARHFRDIGHDPARRDIVYENAQARERARTLFDIANAEGGLVVGTGDLSELALGWCTFGGDQMSSYNVNCSVPKTLARRMVEARAAAAAPALAAVLRDIAATPVSPELIPGGQDTEAALGRYELHDFFIYHHIVHGEGRTALHALAMHAFNSRGAAAAGAVSDEEAAEALAVFFRRFTAQQFKRDSAPAGPQTGAVSLSPRCGWRIPSDISPAAWA